MRVKPFSDFAPKPIMHLENLQRSIRESCLVAPRRWEYANHASGSVSRRMSTMKPVGKPDAGNPHVRFDDRSIPEPRRMPTNKIRRAQPRLEPACAILPACGGDLGFRNTAFQPLTMASKAELCPCSDAPRRRGPVGQTNRPERSSHSSRRENRDSAAEDQTQNLQTVSDRLERKMKASPQYGSSSRRRGRRPMIRRRRSVSTPWATRHSRSARAWTTLRILKSEPIAGSSARSKEAAMNRSRESPWCNGAVEPNIAARCSFQHRSYRHSLSDRKRRRTGRRRETQRISIAHRTDS